MTEIKIPKTLLCLTTMRGAEPETSDSIRATLAEAKGEVGQYEVKGVADIALARNMGFVRAMNVAEQHPEFEVVVFVDDDIIFEPADLFKLVFYAHTYQRAVSGLYSLSSGEAAAARMGQESRFENCPPWANQSWLTGFGFVAVPLPLVRKLAEASEETNLGTGTDQTITCFTWTGPGKETWMSEDTRLCERLGGVFGEQGIILAPIGVGHKKPQNLMPDKKSLLKVAEGRAFDDPPPP